MARLFLLQMLAVVVREAAGMLAAAQDRHWMLSIASSEESKRACAGNTCVTVAPCHHLFNRLHSPHPHTNITLASNVHLQDHLAYQTYILLFPSCKRIALCSSYIFCLNIFITDHILVSSTQNYNIGCEERVGTFMTSIIGF